MRQTIEKVAVSVHYFSVNLIEKPRTSNSDTAQISSSNKPLYDSLVRVSSLRDDLFSRRALKKVNRNLNATQTN